MYTSCLFETFHFFFSQMLSTIQKTRTTFEGDYFDTIPDDVQELVCAGDLSQLMTVIEPRISELPIKRIMFFAISVDQFEIFRYLFDNGLYQRGNDATVLDVMHDSLDRAAFYGALDITRYLIEECHIDRFRIPIYYAVEQGHVSIVKYLNPKAIVTAHYDEQNLFYQSCRYDHSTDIVQYFVEERHLDIHLDHEQPLLLALIALSFNNVKYLIEKGADIHVGDDGNFFGVVDFYRGFEMRKSVDDTKYKQQEIDEDLKRKQIILYLIQQGAEINFDKNEKFAYGRDVIFRQLQKHNTSFFCILVETGGLDIDSFRNLMQQYDDDPPYSIETLSSISLVERMQYIVLKHILNTYLQLSNALGRSKNDIPDSPGLSTVLFEIDFHGLKQRPETEFLRLTLAVLHGWCPLAQELIQNSMSVGVLVRLTRILKQIPLDTFTRRRQKQMAAVETNKAFVEQKKNEFLRFSSIQLLAERERTIAHDLQEL